LVRRARFSSSAPNKTWILF